MLSSTGRKLLMKIITIGMLLIGSAVIAYGVGERVAGTAKKTSNTEITITLYGRIQYVDNTAARIVTAELDKNGMKQKTSDGIAEINISKKTLYARLKTADLKTGDSASNEEETSISDLKKGVSVMATVYVDEDGDFWARRITILPDNDGIIQQYDVLDGKHDSSEVVEIKGVVKEMTETGFIVESESGVNKSVQVNDETKYMVVVSLKDSAPTEGNLSDIKPGCKVHIGGGMDDQGRVQAMGIFIEK